MLNKISQVDTINYYDNNNQQNGHHHKISQMDAYLFYDEPLRSDEKELINKKSSQDRSPLEYFQNCNGHGQNYNGNNQYYK